MNLDEIRTHISSLDNELLTLLAKRKGLSLDVARSKLQNPRPIRDQAREQALLVELINQGRTLGLDAHYVTQIYHTIIEDSVLSQQALLQELLNPQDDTPAISVAFLGLRGSYSNMAARKYLSRFKANMVEHNCDTFQQIFDTVESGQAQYGILPIENTSSGAINDVFDLIQHTSLSIVGELTQPIEHCILVAVDTDVSKLTTLYTHPQVYQQCSQYLATLPGVKVEFCAASSNAMELVAQLQRPDIGAMGSADGGELHGLTPLVKGLANQKQNMTRFIVVARKPVEVAEQIPAKTSFIMSTGQQSGALVETLLVLRNHDIPMTKLESRPIIGNPWEEMFYVDVAANVNCAAMRSALAELKDIVHYIKILGCYPSAEVAPTRVSSKALNQGQVPAPLAAKPSLQHEQAATPTKTAGLALQVGRFTISQQEPLLAVLLSQWPERHDLQEIARQVKEQGGQVLGVPCFGQGDNQFEQSRLQQLREVAQQFDLAPLTTVHTPEQLQRAAESLDVLLLEPITAKHNELLAAAGRSTRPILLPLADTQAQTLADAEQVLAQGNQQLALIDTQARPLADLLRLQQHSRLPLLSQLTQADAVLAELGVVLKGAGVQGFCLTISEDDNLVPLQQLAQRLYQD
ncbi:chorismate mutase [Oceanisphaera profunda]|uniref:Chorismate mutase n=1 Tax=Oceanisphaera profunda TaxID=1416627 RepID=A0A1Y0D9U2_9GAMM|nr:chorismate mutase [Oceanisphaera profunda]